MPKKQKLSWGEDLGLLGLASKKRSAKGAILHAIPQIHGHETAGEAG